MPEGGCAVRRGVGVLATLLVLGFLPLAPGANAEDVPIVKKCVGDPPRQTEDPMSPPCVPFFEGDNGGATWQGVTEDTVTVLVYIEAWITIDGARVEQGRPYRYIDLSRPPEDEETTQIRALRAFNRHFNDRYQTYGRYVHMWAYASNPGSTTPNSRRADAHSNWEALKPFAAVNLASYWAWAYTDAMGRRAVMGFTTERNSSSTRLAEVDPLAWGYHPTVDVEAESFSKAVCAQVAGRPASFSGDSAMQGRDRVYGVISRWTRSLVTDEATFTSSVLELLAECGVSPAAVVHHPFGVDTPDPLPSNDVSIGIAKLKEAEVTTVLWLKGYDTQHSIEATKQAWFPEWIIAGDGRHDSDPHAVAQDQIQWRNAMTISSRQRQDPVTDTSCYWAHSEGAFASSVDGDGERECGSRMDTFTGVRLMFTAIQLAGPELNPFNVEAAFRATSPHEAADAFSAACFYSAGDNSCVTDASLAWWDPVVPVPHAGLGCWRVIEAGKRYLSHQWPDRDIASARSADDPCGGWVSRYRSG